MLQSQIIRVWFNVSSVSFVDKQYLHSIHITYSTTLQGLSSEILVTFPWDLRWVGNNMVKEGWCKEFPACVVIAKHANVNIKYFFRVGRSADLTLVKMLALLWAEYILCNVNYQRHRVISTICIIHNWNRNLLQPMYYQIIKKKPWR